MNFLTLGDVEPILRQHGLVRMRYVKPGTVAQEHGKRLKWMRRQQVADFLSHGNAQIDEKSDSV